MKILLPYAKEGMEISLPVQNTHILQPPAPPEHLAPGAHFPSPEIPIGTPPFQEWIPGKKSALIAVTDHHRFGSYQKELLDLVLKNLSKHSLTATKILIARGTHSPAARNEWSQFYGEEALKQHEFICHDPHKKEDLVELGKTEWGDPVVMSRFVLEADLVIGIGVIRPAARAGYSGGTKMFAIGSAGYPTIMSTHTASLYFHPRSVVGNYRDHPFRQRILAIARKAEKASRAGRFLILNAIQNARKTLKVFSGDMELAWKAGCQFAQDLYEVSVPEPADILICGGGFPADESPYALTSMFNNVTRTDPVPLLKEGGILIALASLAKTPMKGSMDEHFLNLAEKIPYERAAEWIAEMDEKGQAASTDLEGAHRFLAVAALFRHTRGNVFVVGSRTQEVVTRLRFIAFDTFSAAFDQAVKITGPGAHILVAPSLSAISPYVGKRNQN